LFEEDTIIAQASPPGRGGVSIVRLSGLRCLEIAEKLFKKPQSEFQDRLAVFVNSYSQTNQIIDEGLSIYFKSPKSFTGEEVLEFQCHGSPYVVDSIIKTALALGARLARPGEFSERAFLNGKIDLLQAEAIADLIDSQSNQAAKNAIHTLKGAFSKRINALTKDLIQVRMYLEAAIDFPDEEGVDFIDQGKIKDKIESLQETLNVICKQAEQGRILQEGMNIVLAGEPNAGKSSLLNKLAQKESAIVTEIAGTTRDVLTEHIILDGLPLNIIDTAGLRVSKDLIEQEGIRRAWQEIEKADLILYMVESEGIAELAKQSAWLELVKKLGISGINKKLLIIENKIDITQKVAQQSDINVSESSFSKISISVKKNQGIEQLKVKIAEVAGLSEHQESKFTARRRHLDALSRVNSAISQALSHFHANIAAELVAEDLRLAQQCLGEITGEFSSDDLLGEIFSGFCIGK
jgi:tRNA modification GTPase